MSHVESISVIRELRGGLSIGELLFSVFGNMNLRSRVAQGVRLCVFGTWIIGARVTSFL